MLAPPVLNASAGHAVRRADARPSQVPGEMLSIRGTDALLNWTRASQSRGCLLWTEGVIRVVPLLVPTVLLHDAARGAGRGLPVQQLEPVTSISGVPRNQLRRLTGTGVAQSHGPASAGAAADRRRANSGDLFSLTVEHENRILTYCLKAICPCYKYPGRQLDRSAECHLAGLGGGRSREQYENEKGTHNDSADADGALWHLPGL